MWGAVELGLVIVACLVLIIGAFGWETVKKATLKWLAGPYEKSLYAALAEMFKTEEVGDDYRNWQENFRLLHALRLRWIPEVRKELKKLHNSREGRFSWVVMVDTTPSGGWANLTLRPWSIVLLDQEGKQVDSYTDWSRLQASSVGELSRLFDEHYSDSVATLLIKDNNDRVVGRVDTEKIQALVQSGKEQVVDGGWMRE